VATKNRRIPETATGQLAVESPKRVPDRQTGQPSFVLGGQYPITAYYVNLRGGFQTELSAGQGYYSSKLWILWRIEA
jgi:hypothetical protein